jgi:hypothetical protein
LNMTATTNTPTNATALPPVPSPLTTTTGNNTTRETPAPTVLGVDAHEGAAVAGSDGTGDSGDNNGAAILTVTATSIPGDDLAVVSASLDPVRTGASPPVRSAACGGPRGVGVHASVGFVVALIGWLALS